ncbi:MAG: helix-turn-helix domain-containing protein [Euryarchaeota archaeon]|jgi:ArsR family transcriptional regulator|nr:helix-turn-helix domain-containing protein [Euryarchaeota archaeon]MBT4391640.1 helix-turn-helix domain-containing protein [Euryarchaeota archaeon]MBT4802780.1 helix-turn-helix domain-containing protein [Euryarchaeota archaeon]MBT5613592.1 helix-turn-helix domain-containing protein [Euryarchaeota archaeon]MBT6684278.1 helix-turn-helix domain-containing protein [Euryarchaeota archaeon]
MVSFDEALSILENSIRRQILKLLVKEPHYPLQISELINVSQQAVIKHLKVLEKADFVESQIVASEKGGPPKKMYKVDQSFSIRLDLGPDLFRAEHRKMPRGGVMKLSEKLPNDLNNVIIKMGTKRKLEISEAIEALGELDAALEKIDDQRDAIIAMHQQVKKKVSSSVSNHSNSYEERQLAHAIMNQPRRPLDLDLFSHGMRIKSMDAEEMMNNFRETLLRDLSTSKGNFIAANKGTPLPWWLIR